MRVYIVDGSNMVRRPGYDPRFPEVEVRRTETMLDRLCRAAAPWAGRIRVEIFFDGPRREMVPVEPPVSVRFSIDGDADAAILGAARATLARGRGVVVATADRQLAAELLQEGARVIGFSELERRLREGKI